MSWGEGSTVTKSNLKVTQGYGVLSIHKATRVSSKLQSIVNHDYKLLKDKQDCLHLISATWTLSPSSAKKQLACLVSCPRQVQKQMQPLRRRPMKWLARLRSRSTNRRSLTIFTTARWWRRPAMYWLAWDLKSTSCSSSTTPSHFSENFTLISR